MNRQLDLAVDQVYLVEAVYERLIQALIRGQIEPGERLYINPLAEQLNVSPTPLRQALSRMEGEGLVKTIPRRGIYVIKPTEDEVRDLFEVRLMCELFAIERAIQKITPEGMEQLERLVNEVDEILISENRSEWAYGQKDRQLHSFVVGLAGNVILSEWHSNLRVQSLVIAQNPEITLERAEETSQEHHRILETLQSQDLEAAREAIRQHLIKARDAALKALAKK
ncbi:MAG: GntR family transcriptional regulator [Anaerolineales bacterium]|nr:GntR family transcriptional regulator [Anaerolineales bacterium]